MNQLLRFTWFVIAVLVLLPSQAGAFSIVSAAGADAADIQDAVDEFRALLGDPNNGNAPGPLPAGRREINWDGGGATEGTPPVTPFTVFEDTRGATFTTPGVGLIQAPVTGGATGNDLADINPDYANTFEAFSPLRLFAPVGSNVTDGSFSVPGTGGSVLAGVSGFGIIFSDVDLEGATTIDFFGITGQLIASLPVPAAPGDAGFSFLGIVLEPDEGLIRSVRIITGNTALGATDDPANGVDVVVMDDFLYGEPQEIVLQQVPQASTLLLLGASLVVAAGALGLRARRRPNR